MELSWSILFQTIASIVGGAAFIKLFANIIVGPFVKAQLDKAVVEFKADIEHRNELARLREATELAKVKELFLHRAVKISDSQFDLYNSLWCHIVKLELIADELWNDGVTKESLKKFISTLKTTSARADESALIIGQKEFAQLKAVLEVLKGYRVGKDRLLGLKDVDDNAAYEIQRQIEQNWSLLSDFKELKARILVQMRSSLGVHPVESEDHVAA